MLSVTMTHNTPISSNSVEELPRLVREATQRAHEEIKALIEPLVKDDHRYTHRTHNLRNSTKVDNKFRYYQGLTEAYIDGSVAEYGKFIHDGFSSWQPDPFMTNAIENNLGAIESIFDKHFDSIFSKFLGLKGVL
jgi:hypothetical protein